MIMDITIKPIILNVLLLCLQLFGNGFIVNSKVISIKSNGLLAALGDFDSDKLTDLFVISPNGATFQILKAQDKPDFTIDPQLQCYASKKDKIVGLIPGDFQGKAFMDLIVITKETDDSSNNHFNLYLVPGNRSHLACGNLLERNYFATVSNQPLALDYNGDMIVDLLAQDVDGNRYIYSSIKGSTVNRTKLPDGDANGKIRSPNSNAFIDLNGDFRSDLFIEGEKSMEYWFHNKSGFQKVKDIAYPKYSLIGMSTFADVNADGIVDHILAVCGDNDCTSSALLAYDGHKNEWIVINDNFPDVPGSPSSSSSSGSSSSSLASTASLTFALTKKDDSEPFSFPLKLRHADVDGDGFPDLIGLMKPKEGKPVKVVILRNVRNDSNILGRSFLPQWLVNTEAGSDSKPVLAAFADLGEDGRADVVVNYRVDGKKNEYKISAVLNDQMVDACFLKVLVTSGLCYGDCPSHETSMDSSSSSSSPAIAYGTNQPGPAITYQLIDPEGHVRTGFAGQLSQSSDFSLQMPYTIFGLGQLPNFVDNLTASIPATLDNQIRVASWSQIVPDAQVVVIPYPPDEPRNWRTKLFITPSDIVLSTLITLACICCLLVLIILVLHRKELMEDLAEHEEYKRHWPESR